MNLRAVILVLGAAALVIIGGVYFASRSGGDALPASRVRVPPAPDLTLHDYDGREVKFSDFRGRAILINAWAAWCPFCREELKDFAAIQKEFSDQMVMIAVDRAEPRDTAKKFSDELGVSDDLIFLLDPDDTFYRAIGGFSMPETIFVDREGLVRFHKRGPMKREEIRRRIEDLLISRE